MMSARVASASESAACEQATIAAGISSADLMRRAGLAAAGVIRTRYPLDQWPRVGVLAGPGNNGGDGRIIAAALAASGYHVSVVDSKTDAPPAGLGEGGLIVDALLGTGSSGAPRGNIASLITEMNTARAAGAVVIALDLPSGVDATTGTHDLAASADLTLALGTMKRGLLLGRDLCGEILVLDIGLTDGIEMTSLPTLIDRPWADAHVPAIAPTAHKGTRRRLAVIGGGIGMAGAAILAGRGALRSGIGLLHLLVADRNVGVIHAAVPEALAGSWPNDADALVELVRQSDTLAIGPGLGRSDATRELVERVLLAYAGPVVLDADALNVFAADVSSLALLLSGRKAIITPHPAELGRLLGIGTAEVLERRFEVAVDLARELGATVLLKGAPTVIFAPNGDRHAVAAGTAALATGGSGDVLTGICGTLLSQMDSSPVAAACAAFVHGRAAELCGSVRGVTLDDILRAMPAAWNESLPSPEPGVIARLQAQT